ncbi:hypothetical protein [Novosphingobium sp.]|uniref:hypothetical protein n=1 Tax=Novosphingobium sp. TaxID=1874826 RepID=UPI00286DE29D|nr:hypothetical protein [Novosphingobium sp.]
MPKNFAYERSARGDFRFWALLLFGAVFLYAGLTIDPQTNCNESGECAPWLVPIAAIMGALATATAIARLLANTRRGSRFDPDTGDLVWWQNRANGYPGDHGRIHPAEIGRIRIVKESEGADGVHLYDRHGNRQPFFDSEVFPGRAEHWAAQLIARYPHIKLDIVG